MYAQTTVDVSRAGSALRKAVRGEVRFGAASRAMDASDAASFRRVPIGA